MNQLSKQVSILEFAWDTHHNFDSGVLSYKLQFLYSTDVENATNV